MSKNEDQIRSYYTNLAKDNNGIYSYWGCALLRSSRRVRRWELKSYPDLPYSRGSAICLFMKSSFGLGVASALMVAGTMVVVDLCPLFPHFWLLDGFSWSERKSVPEGDIYPIMYIMCLELVCLKTYLFAFIDTWKHSVCYWERLSNEWVWETMVCLLPYIKTEARSGQRDWRVFTFPYPESEVNRDIVISTVWGSSGWFSAAWTLLLVAQVKGTWLGNNMIR